MKRSYLYLLFTAAFLLFLAFSTGAPAFLAPAALSVLLLIYAPLSVHLAKKGLVIELNLDRERVSRGENTALHIHVRFASVLPVSPVVLTIRINEDNPAHTVEIGENTREAQYSLTFPTIHAGCMYPRVYQCEISDLFHLYTVRFLPEMPASELLVLPVAFQVNPLLYTQVDAGMGTMAKANEDITTPSDIRSYQPGDPLKKVHWKLSARKQEILVRRFEEPVLPEALLLLNCESPGSADIQDALLETAYSVMQEEVSSDHTIRLPLLGVKPTEVEGRMGLPLIAENLARMEWTHGTSFEEVLLIESSRLRRVGATVIVTFQLTGDLVEIMCQMRRMGPALRLYLITVSPADPDLLPFVSRLQQAGCEVCYVTPSISG